MTRGQRIIVAAATSLALLACLRLEGPPPTLENGDPCTSDAMCASDSVCEFDSAVSGAVCRVRGGCVAHADCGVDGACTFGSCGPAECMNDAICGLYACDLTRRQCFDSCAGDSSCSSAGVCRDGECLSATCTEATAARVCDGAVCYGGGCIGGILCEDYGCAAGYTCESLQCVRHCTNDADCERYTCSVELGECRESCYGASDCQPDYVCKDTFCQAP